MTGNKEWRLNPETKEHILYFCPYEDEVPVASLTLDEETGEWLFKHILGNDVTYLSMESLEQAKKYAEDDVKEYFRDQSAYYAELLMMFDNKLFAKRVQESDTRYMLVSVCELEISTEQYISYETAYAAMLREFCEAYGKEISEEAAREFCEDDAGICDWNAYVCDGKNHDNYTWRIVAII